MSLFLFQSFGSATRGSCKSRVESVKPQFSSGTCWVSAAGLLTLIFVGFLCLSFTRHLDSIDVAI